MASNKSIWTSTAYGKAFAFEGAPEGSFLVWWLLLSKDLAETKQAGVAVRSKWGAEVNSSRVLAVVGVAAISWDVVIEAWMGIGVVGGVVSGSKTTAAATGWVTKVSVLFGFIIFGAGSAILTIGFSRFKGTNGEFDVAAAGCSLGSSEGRTTLLIFDGGLTSLMTTQYCSTS